MGFEQVMDARNWAALPFGFWVLVLFVFGSMVGSFLNVCIHRLPLGQSVVSPPSHCPHCKYSIPWYLNLPLITWVALRGRCKNCRAPIAIRYFLVELLTAVTFSVCWLWFGHQSVAVALIYCLFLAGMIAATFIDFEHFIIPDEITFGGMAAGLVCAFLFPQLHHETARWSAFFQSALGLGVGLGIVYLILRLGKLLFGRQRLSLPQDTKITFTETAVHFSDQVIPYEELFYRRSDVVVVRARTVELIDRGYRDVVVRLSPDKLRIGQDEFNPEMVPHLEAVGAEIVLPREAMGFGDVKFMGAIGAFLGWQATLFSLMSSSIIGSVVGVILILSRRREWSSRLPYGPYIALGALIWMFFGRQLLVLIFPAG